MYKEKVKGVILILSCKKLLDKRNPDAQFEDYFQDWKVHVFVGDPNLKEEYKIEGKRIIIKCEDSYLYLMKKLCTSIQILHDIYDIQLGILRMDDDVVVDKGQLAAFLNRADLNMFDCVGTVVGADTKGLRRETWIYDYYMNRQSELEQINKLHDMSVQLSQLIIDAPNLLYTKGPMSYWSSKASNLIWSYFLKTVKGNIFFKEMFHNHMSQPYMIEDIGVGYILQKHNVVIHNYPNFVSERKEVNPVGYHTNSYK